MITGTIAIVRPYGLKTRHPGLVGLIAVDDGTFLIFAGSVVALVPGGPRLRLHAPCQAEPDATGTYALSVTLTSPVPFP